MKKLRDKFELILSSSQHSPPNEHFISLNIHSLLSQLAIPGQQTAISDEILNPALNYIHNHFEKEANLEQLASFCNLSISHFIRRFKKYVNCTPHEYLLLYRLRQAKQMLQTSTASIEAIAEECGFNSASHFSRAFQKNNNLTPSAFRQMHF